MQLLPKVCGLRFPFLRFASLEKPKLSPRSQEELEKEWTQPKVGVIFMELQNQDGLGWEGP